MSAYRVAQRYARSLIELAKDRGTLEEALKDVETIGQALENRDLYLLLQSPIINAGKKKKVLKKIFGERIAPLTMLFIERLASKGRESQLPAILNAFEEQYRELKGISVVQLKTARPLNEEAVARIKKALEESGLTRQTVDIEQQIDESLIGGFVLQLDDKLYDTSVKRKLDKLRREYSTK